MEKPSTIASDVTAAMRLRLERALARPAGRRRPLRVDARNAAGWLDDARAAEISVHGDVFDVRAERIAFVPGVDDVDARTAALERVARALAAVGRLTAWRDERYAVASELGAPPWFLLERAAARYFGVRTWAAHVNGLVRRGDDIAMWIARRSPTKSIDPSRLDNLVGGGIAAGSTVAATVVKEAWEEAGIAADVVTQARPAGAVHVCREQPDGLQRETIFVHDLWLPPDFRPVCQDGEAVAHRLLSLDQVARIIANDEGPDVMTADASLVALDCLLRHGAIARGNADYAPLAALRQPALELER